MPWVSALERRLPGPRPRAGQGPGALRGPSRGGGTRRSRGDARKSKTLWVLVYVVYAYVLLISHLFSLSLSLYIYIYKIYRHTFTYRLCRSIFMCIHVRDGMYVCIYVRVCLSHSLSIYLFVYLCVCMYIYIYPHRNLLGESDSCSRCSVQKCLTAVSRYPLWQADIA